MRDFGKAFEESAADGRESHDRLKVSGKQRQTQ
jgi:hypothetical protein